MHVFNYGFLKENIPADFLGYSSIISDLKAKEDFRVQQYPETFSALKKQAIVESVTGSNAIEGIVTTSERMTAIVNGSLPTTHDEYEICGYKDALNLIHSDFKDMDLNDASIRLLHKMICEFTHPDEAGQYKLRDNFITETHADGSIHLRFKPVSAADTPGTIEQFLMAYYSARQDSDIHPLLLIPCVITDFLCIHPFSDGNGRVSRLLTILLLYISGYDICSYVSLENKINTYKESYYEALRQSSVGWHENANDYTPVMLNFLQILYKCFQELDEHFTDVSLKKARKSERVEVVIMSSIVPVSKADILHKLPDVSEKTVELALSKLLKAGKIIKIGTFRDARYTRK